MDAHRFDAISKQVARRRLIGAGGAGLGALLVGALPGPRRAAAAHLRQATPAATPVGGAPDAVEIDGAWFCNQAYALCNTAVCARTADDASKANCPCVVLNGYSIGFTPCAQRAQQGRRLVSTFSTANVNSEFGILECPASAAWVNCLDYPCELNPQDPALATCECAVVETGPFRTFGGYCDANACTSELLSGTPLNTPGVSQYLAGMQQAGQTVTLPQACSGA